MFRRQAKPVLSALSAMRAELEAAQAEQVGEKAADITMQRLWNEPEMTGSMTADVLAELERILGAAMTSIAAEFAKQGLRLSWDVFDREAQKWAASYGYNLIKQINESTQRQIGQAISSWIGKPAGFPDLVEDIRRIMPARAVQPGIRDRARLIAQTETTRVYAESRQAAMASEGLERLTWHTSADEIVCPICRPLDEQEGSVKTGVLNPGDGQYYKPPAHPACRCWLSGSTEELDARVQAQEETQPQEPGTQGSARTPEDKLRESIRAKRPNATDEDIQSYLDVMSLDKERFVHYGKKLGIGDLDNFADDFFRGQEDKYRQIARDRWQYRESGVIRTDDGNPFSISSFSDDMREIAERSRAESFDEMQSIFSERYGVSVEMLGGKSVAEAERDLRRLLNIAENNDAADYMLKNKTDFIRFANRPLDRKTAAAEWRTYGNRSGIEVWKTGSEMPPSTWVHELGHGAEDYVPLNERMRIFDVGDRRVSMYAWESINEDFAETFNFMFGGRADVAASHVPDRVSVISKYMPWLKR